ncbi:hypothetical protein PQO01_19575 [Lentisphaera marina]|uniref:hypothetical protein n=1 Tax=Lentisphaera marina TaxID=1111041 RepID=UPI0023670642|nr:hypothetical protein [Lentisphaera marina]MDD7987157.1 hypothetical protein [Lentisphaera marina]
MSNFFRKIDTSILHDMEVFELSTLGPDPQFSHCLYLDIDRSFVFRYQCETPNEKHYLDSTKKGFRKLIKLIEFMKYHKVTDFEQICLDGTTISIKYKFKNQDQKNITLVNVDYSDDRDHKSFYRHYINVICNIKTKII